MGKLFITIATTLDGAFEAPVPAPDGWLVMDDSSREASLDMWRAAHAMVMGRPTYEDLSTVWPQMAELPGLESYAHQMNTMPKYVASRTLEGPLGWNATLLDGDVADAIRRLKDEHEGALIVTGAGAVTRALLAAGLVDELRLSVSPCFWPAGPRLFDDLGPQRLQLLASTTYPSGVVGLRYRPTAP